MIRQVTKRTEITSYLEMVPAKPGEEGASHLLTVHETYCGNYLRPQINLAGKWIEDAGFNHGDKVHVSVSENRLVIEKLIEKEG